MAGGVSVGVKGGVSVVDSSEGNIHLQQSAPKSDEPSNDNYDVESPSSVLPFLESLLRNIQQRLSFFKTSPPRNAIFDYDVTSLEQTNQFTKRHNFVRNRRPMTDCLSNCIRRVQRVIACKNLCF